MYGTYVVSYRDIRLLLLYIEDVVSLGTHFHKQHNKHTVVTSRQVLCLKEPSRMCVPVLNAMEKCSGSDESGLYRFP